MKKIYEFKKGTYFKASENIQTYKIIEALAIKKSDYEYDKNGFANVIHILRDFTITIELNYTEP